MKRKKDIEKAMLWKIRKLFLRSQMKSGAIPQIN